VFTYPHASLRWARQWPLLTHLQAQLQTATDRKVYDTSCGIPLFLSSVGFQDIYQQSLPFGRYYTQPLSAILSTLAARRFV
jgi:hypothetical protein